MIGSRFLLLFSFNLFTTSTWTVTKTVFACIRIFCANKPRLPQACWAPRGGDLLTSSSASLPLFSPHQQEGLICQSTKESFIICSSTELINTAFYWPCTLKYSLLSCQLYWIKPSKLAGLFCRIRCTKYLPISVNAFPLQKSALVNNESWKSYRGFSTYILQRPSLSFRHRRPHRQSLSICWGWLRLPGTSDCILSMIVAIYVFLCIIVVLYWWTCEGDLLDNFPFLQSNPPVASARIENMIRCHVQLKMMMTMTMMSMMMMSMLMKASTITRMKNTPDFSSRLPQASQIACLGRIWAGSEPGKDYQIKIFCGNIFLSNYHDFYDGAIKVIVGKIKVKICKRKKCRPTLNERKKMSWQQWRNIKK